MSNDLTKINHVAELLPGFQYLYSGCADKAAILSLLQKRYSLETSDARTILLAHELKMSPLDVYYDISTGADSEQIEQCFGKCRYVAGSLEDMKKINEAAKKIAPEALHNHRELIGIHVFPRYYKSDGHPGFHAEDLAGLAPEFRKLAHISVGGCFVRGSLKAPSQEPVYGAELGRFFRACYETAKLATVSIPCGMVFLNVAGGIDALRQNEQKHPDTFSDCCRTAQIIRHQNETAFYARLLIS